MNPLRDWIAGFALDAVRAQEIWNRAQEGNSILPPEVQTALMLLQRYDVTLHAVVTGERKLGFELTAAPLSLGYSIQFRSRSDLASSFRFTVEQVPLAPGASEGA